MNTERVEAAGGLTTPGLTTAQGLLCTISRVHFGVPLDYVEKLIEFEVVPPPPLALPWIGGIGMHDRRVVMSIALLHRNDPPARRLIKGVLLKVPGSECGWALEVDAVDSMAAVQLVQKSVRVGTAKLPSWIAAATTEGRTVGWFNVKQMIEELSASAD